MFSYPVLPNKLGAYRIPLAYQEIYQGKIIFFTIGKLLQSTYVFLKKKKKKDSLLQIQFFTHARRISIST